MANDKYIRQLTAATGLDGTHSLIVDQGSGAAKKATISEAVAVSNAHTRRYNPLDYGAVGDGNTDDTAALQAMITAAKATTGSKSCMATLDLHGKSYLVTASLDFTDAEQLIIEGHGATITSHATDKVAMDFLGSCRCVIRNLRIHGDTTNVPAVGISLGRSTAVAGEDSGHHLLENVQITGSISLAGIYNVASEINTIRNCWILPSAPTTVKYGIYYSATNDESIGSDYVTRSATASAAGLWVQNVNIGAPADATQYIPLFLGDEAGNITLRDSYLYTCNDMPVVKTNGEIYGLTLQNVLVEGTVGSLVHLAAKAGAGTQNSITLDNVACSVYTNNLILQDAGTTCYGLRVTNCRGQDGSNESNITLSGTVYGAHIDGWYTTTAGTVTVNNLYGGYLAVADHTVTVSTTDYASQIVYNKSGNTNYTRLQNVKVGLHSDTMLARLKKLLTATKSWAIGDVLNGATATTTLDITGALSGNLGIASINASPAGGIILRAEPYDGGAWVTLLNQSGETFAGATRTLRVLVFQVD